MTEGALRDSYTGLWTNWWRHELDLERKKTEGLLKILAARQVMTEKNLFDTNGPKGAQVGRAPRCTGEALTRRTMDGTCNDLGRPTAGAANARFGRNIDLAKSSSPDEADLLSPSPRQISLQLLARDLDGATPKVKEVPWLNLSAASWIQFQTHDWFSHPQQSTETWRVTFGKETMFVPKSSEDPHLDLAGFPLLKTFKNENTHWWDASQLYGSDDATALRLRSKDGKVVPGGLLHLEDGRLPIVEGKEDSGFTKNWWVGLSMLHTLFAREHNAIAKKVKEAHPELSDDQIFHIARMVNAAVMAKIHTVEWTPAILDNAQLRAGMHLNWFGLGDRKPILGHPRDPNLVKVPYSLTEEFTSVYRMHSLLPENVELFGLGSKKTATAPIAKSVKGQIDTPDFSTSDLFYSFGRQHPGQMTLHNFPRFLQELTVEREMPIAGKVTLAKIDMGTIDILRDRERGVPRYNEFRRQLQLLPITKLEDLFLVPPDGTPAGKPVSGELSPEAQRYVRELRSVYGKAADGSDLPEAETVERLDLLVGCLAESVRAPGFGFGETAFQVFILMASRRLQADRFYTDDYRAEIYTAEGIEWVEKATMKNVLLRHYPELSPSLEGIDNAFFPWRR